MSLSWLKPDWDAPLRVASLASTRQGGCSLGPYAGLNLAAHVGDTAAAVAANRQLLASVLPGEPLWLSQVHGAQVVHAESAAQGVEADACVARTPNLVLAVMHADCLPVLFCDDGGSVVAVAHAGWRGLAAGVLENTVAAMAVPGQRLRAWLGAAISQPAFEVGAEVRAAFMAADDGAAVAFSAAAPGKWRCDLYALARLRLARVGVTRVFGGACCTYADAGRFYSYRRDGSTGRMATLIWLQAESGRRVEVDCVEDDC